MNDQKTRWNDSEFIEAIRLINKFFPESKTFVHKESGIGLYQMVNCMGLADFYSDYSCEHYGIPEGPNLGLSEKGGFTGENQQIYFRIIEHTKFRPQGRVVVIPDALGKGWSIENLKPFVCATKTLSMRLNEIEYFFDESHDRILVFETGEAICIDHDLRVFWAKSKINKLQKF